MAGFLYGKGNHYYITEDGILQIFTNKCKIVVLIPVPQSLVIMQDIPEETDEIEKIDDYDDFGYIID